MSEAPERIRAFVEPPDTDNDDDIGGDESASGIEYIRADIHEARIKELELPADDTGSYDKGYTQGYSEGWGEGELMVQVHLDMALTRIKELEAQLAAQRKGGNA